MICYRLLFTPTVQLQHYLGYSYNLSPNPHQGYNRDKRLFCEVLGWLVLVSIRSNIDCHCCCFSRTKSFLKISLILSALIFFAQYKEPVVSLKRTFLGPLVLMQYYKKVFLSTNYVILTAMTGARLSSHPMSRSLCLVFPVIASAAACPGPEECRESNLDRATVENPKSDSEGHRDSDFVLIILYRVRDIFYCLLA